MLTLERYMTFFVKNQHFSASKIGVQDRLLVATSDFCIMAKN